MARRSRVKPWDVPFLLRVSERAGLRPAELLGYPVPALAAGIDLRFTSNVTFFVGDNGSGKSTLLEALATGAGFPAEGGNRDHQRPGCEPASALAGGLKLTWSRKAPDGFFARGESLFDLADYLDRLGPPYFLGGPVLARSHGEGFLAMMLHRMAEGIVFLDEPEAGLSLKSQLALLQLLRERSATGRVQYLVATHSPVLLHLPGAQCLRLEPTGLQPVDPRADENVVLTRDFLNRPEAYLRQLEPQREEEG